VLLVHDTPYSSDPPVPVGLGLGTIAQLVPFHRSTSVPDAEDPTAKQLVALVHDTSYSAPGGLGLGTIAQLMPFQRSISVPDPEYPTAKQLVLLVHDTSFKTLSVVPLGLGLATGKNGGPTPCGTPPDAEAVRGTATPVATSNTTATNRNLTRARPRTVAPSAHTRTSPRP
jgi:hypothetical protein